MTPNRIHAEQAPRFNPANAGAQAAVGEIRSPSGSAACYKLRFRSLFDEGRGFAFPCDATGQVDLDALSERARISTSTPAPSSDASSRCPPCSWVRCIDPKTNRTKGIDQMSKFMRRLEGLELRLVSPRIENDDCRACGVDVNAIRDFRARIYSECNSMGGSAGIVFAAEKTRGAENDFSQAEVTHV